MIKDIYGKEWFKMDLERSLDSSKNTQPPLQIIKAPRTKEELLAKRVELAAKLAGVPEGKDWKSELEFNLVQEELAKIAKSEATPDLMTSDSNSSDKLERPRGVNLH